MNKCENCGNHVTEQFSRVYGDSNNNLHRCMNCIPSEHGGRTLLRQGAGADPAFDPSNYK